MGRGLLLALLLLAAVSILIACGPSAGRGKAGDDRERAVLVCFSARDNRGQLAYVWAPGVALGENRVAMIYDTYLSEAPEEVFVEWPDGSRSAAEVVNEARAYRLVVLHAPGGVPYPPLAEVAPELRQGEEVTVRAYASRWYQTVVTQEPYLEPGVRSAIPPFTEMRATVLSSGAPMPPLLAKDEEAPFLALQMDSSMDDKRRMIAGGMVLREGELVGIVSVSSNLGDVWAAPVPVLRGGNARTGSPVPSADGQTAREQVYNRSIRQGPLEMVLWRTYQSGTGFTVQLRLQNHSSQPLVLARTEDLGLQRRDQHSPAFLVIGRGTRVAPVSIGYDRPTQTAAGAESEGRTGPPPVWMIEPNREQMVAHFTFPTTLRDGEEAVFRWTGITVEGDHSGFDFEFTLAR